MQSNVLYMLSLHNVMCQIHAVENKTEMEGAGSHYLTLQGSRESPGYLDFNLCLS